MDEEIIKSLETMKIECVVIKGKIPGISQTLELVMDAQVFEEWKQRLKGQEIPKKKMGFGQAFVKEAKSLVSRRN